MQSDAFSRTILLHRMSRMSYNRCMSTLLLEDTDFLPEFTPEACSAKGCYSDDLCAKCRLADGASCDGCGAPGEVLGGMFGELVLCATCKANDEGGI